MVQITLHLLHLANKSLGPIFDHLVDSCYSAISATGTQYGHPIDETGLTVKEWRSGILLAGMLSSCAAPVGKLVDSSTRQPIAGAYVIYKFWKPRPFLGREACDTAHIYVTDAQGKFKMWTYRQPVGRQVEMTVPYQPYFYMPTYSTSGSADDGDAFQFALQKSQSNANDRVGEILYTFDVSGCQLDASTRNTIIAAEQLGYAEVMSTLHGNASAGQRLLDEIKAIQNGGR